MPSLRGTRNKAVVAALNTARKYGKKYAEGGKIPIPRPDPRESAFTTAIAQSSPINFLSKIAPRGIPWEQYRRSQNIEDERTPESIQMNQQALEALDISDAVRPDAFANGGPTDDEAQFGWSNPAGDFTPTGALDPTRVKQKEYPMEPMLQEHQMGEEPLPDGFDPKYLGMNDAGQRVDMRTNTPLPEEPMTRRPNVLPLAKNAEGNLEVAMPKVADVVSNMLPGVVAPAVPIKAGEMVLGAGGAKTAKTAKVAESAKATGSTADEIEKLLSEYHAAKAAPAMEAATDFHAPLDVSNFKKLPGKKEGTMPGGWMEDQATGAQWYVKEAPSIEQANNEKLTAELYRITGTPVADVRLTTINGKPALASKRIQGEQLSNTAIPYNNIKDLHSNYAVDAWLNNRDAVGVGHENPLGNIIVDKNGQAYRIDTGGGLDRKGTGGLKEFPHSAAEIDTMKDPDYNHLMAHVFGDIHPNDLIDGAAKVAAVDPMEISKLVEMYGPKSQAGKADLLSKLLSRQKAIAEQAGLEVRRPAGSMAKPEREMTEEPYKPVEYTAEDEQAYWDSIEKQANNEYALAKGTPDMTDDIISKFKDLDWKTYRPPEVKSLPRIPGLSKSTEELESIGVNPRVGLEHGSKEFAGYPEEFRPVRSKKAHEPALFASDYLGQNTKSPAYTYAHGDKSKVTQYVAAPKKAAEVQWSDITGGYYDYNPEYMHQLIEAAHKKGLDIVAIHGIHDIGGGSQTQYAILNPAILRAPHAAFDPSKLHLMRPLAGLVGGGLFGYGMLGGENKEPKMNRGGTPKKKAGGGAAMDNWVMKQASRNLHSEGMIQSPVPGRTDKLPLNVPAGSYVLPADFISALGQNNSQAGGQIAAKMFSSSPLGMKPMRGGKGGGSRLPAAQSLRGRGFADGGSSNGNVSIIAAGGEFVISPDVVRDIGHGSMTAGHKVLDALVLKVRKEHIRTLKSLKPPKK